MSRLFSLLVSSLLLTGVLASTTPAEAITCVGAGDVTLLGPAGCTQGGLTFKDFSVAVAGFNGAKIFLSTLSTTIGQDVNLNFQVAHDPSPVSLADILFMYSITADAGKAVDGVDLFNPGQNVTIREVVCGQAFVNGTCAGGPLANLVVGSNSSLAASFNSDPTVFVRKDIQFLNNAFISEFTQSHDLSAVPEPATMLLLGSSLVGLGMAARRRRAQKALGA